MGSNNLVESSLKPVAGIRDDLMAIRNTLREISDKIDDVKFNAGLPTANAVDKDGQSTSGGLRGVSELTADITYRVNAIKEQLSSL